MTGAVFDEAGRRDPGRARTWIVLVDGDNHQLEMIRSQAARRGITITVLIDFIHVLEYLWKAAWCFHPARAPAIEAWVTAQGLDILHGRAGQVIARIEGMAAPAPPRPGSEHAKIICEEFSLANFQLQMGRPRREVLHDLGVRTGVDDVRSLAAILIIVNAYAASVIGPGVGGGMGMAMIVERLR